MEFASQIEVAADVIWIRLHANGEMMLRRLRSLVRMDKSLFYQVSAGSQVRVRYP